MFDLLLRCLLSLGFARSVGSVIPGQVKITRTGRPNVYDAGSGDFVMKSLAAIVNQDPQEPYVKRQE
jgi:hypothetical protein